MIISQDVKMEDLPVRASLWVFLAWRALFRLFTMLSFLLFNAMLNPATLWAERLRHLELGARVRNRENAVKCNVSSVPELVTEWQVVKRVVCSNSQ